MFGNISGSIFGSIFGSMFGEKSSYYTSFGSKTGQPLSTLVTSRIVKLKTILAASVISITGGEYQLNGGEWTDVNGTVGPTDKIRVRLLSSSSNATETGCSVAIAGIGYLFTVTTMASAVEGLFFGDDPLTFGTDELTY